MAIPLANGFDMLTATIEEPRVGRWVASITATVEEGFTMGDKGDPITLDFEDGLVTYEGTIIRGAVFGGKYEGLAVGGKGGLSTVIDAKAYIGVPMAVVLADLMALTGETLEGTTSEAVTSFTVAHWQRTSGQAQNALDAIREATGADWRIFRTGTLWFGSDTFPTLNFEHEHLDEDNSFGERLVSPKSGAPELRPGVTFDSERVQYVTTKLSPSSLTQTYLV